jgi:CBS domain-containing protein
MKVREVMSSDVKIASPDQTIQEAARVMADIDAGVLPVGEKDQLVGMITDRDIAVRAVAMGLGPDTLVRKVMSHEVLYCAEDDELEAVASNMSDIQVRRLPVINKSKRLVGIISLGDIALADGPESAGQAICGISEPGGKHSQSEDRNVRV